jgi:DNA-binding IclR family transcriptional regulator
MRVLVSAGQGATVAQIADATAWNSNTVRGFLAGLKKKGYVVEVRDRIRQVGPNKTGAKGLNRPGFVGGLNS